MKSRSEKWCKTCNAWATTAKVNGCAQEGGSGGVAGSGDGEGAKKVRTLYCAKCSDVKAKQKSRTDNAKWAESVGTVRCSSDGCLSLFVEQAEMSEAQKKHKAAGERLCRKCALEREKAALRANC